MVQREALLIFVCVLLWGFASRTAQSARPAQCKTLLFGFFFLRHDLAILACHSPSHGGIYMKENTQCVLYSGPGQRVLYAFFALFFKRNFAPFFTYPLRAFFTSVRHHVFLPRFLRVFNALFFLSWTVDTPRKKIQLSSAQISEAKQSPRFRSCNPHRGENPRRRRRGCVGRRGGPLYNKKPGPDGQRAAAWPSKHH